MTSTFFATRLRASVLAFLTAALLLLSGLAAPASATPHLLVDANTGAVLSAEDAFDPWYPASLTKLMTIYVTLEALRDGEITMRSPVTITPRSLQEPPARMGFPAGSVITVETALEILVVKSANDVAVALAQAVGGSEEAFVTRMNAAAFHLGMTATHFVNPNGLYAAGHVSSARDMAVLALAILGQYPEMRPLFGLTAIAYRGAVIESGNDLLERFPGADGMKTGYICSSGYNIVATATRNGRTLVAIVLGRVSERDRAEATARLLDAGFATPRGLVGDASLFALVPDEAPAAAPADLRSRVCGPSTPQPEPLRSPLIAAGDTSSHLVPEFHVMDPVPIELGGAEVAVPGLAPLTLTAGAAAGLLPLAGAAGGFTDPLAPGGQP